ncbi:MAG: hypothetical protein ABIA47_00695, partial [bacterium]
YNCSGSGSFNLAGGSGAAEPAHYGGGGGGGMLRVEYTTDASTGCTIASLDAESIAPGGAAGGGAAVAGTAGTLSYEEVGTPWDESRTEVDVENSAPSVANVKICADSADGGSCTNLGSITPSVGVDRDFDIFADITDNNGTADISSVSGVFYRSAKGSGCEPDKNECYSLTCSLDEADVSTETDRYICEVTVAHWIDPTSSLSDDYFDQNWVISITAIDGSAASDTGTNTTEVAEVSSVSIPSTLDFGERILGSKTTDSDNQELQSTNQGNTDADLNIRADSSALSCSIQGSIPVGNVKFDNADLAFDSMATALTTGDQELDLESSPSDGALIRRTDDLNAVTGSSYWGIEIPSLGVGGVCSSSITVTSFKDSI